MKANHAILAVIISSLFVVSTADANYIVTRFQEGVWNGTVADAGYTTDDAGGRQNQNQDDNYNGATQEIKSGADPFHGVFGFDVSAASTFGRDVAFATLTLTVSYDGDFSETGATYAHDLYELPAGNTSWSETTATFNDQVTLDVTEWYDAGGNPSTLRVAGDSGTFLDGTGLQELEDGQTVTFTIPAIVATDWVQNPASFGGLFFRQTNGTGTDRTFWHTSESSTASFRPLLTLTLVPEPASGLLLLLGSLGCLRRRGRRV